MSDIISCGLTAEELAAEVAEAERETLEFEERRRTRREAELAAMDRRTRYNETHRAFRRCRQAERRARKLGALPPDQTEDERARILAIYEEAEAWSVLTGIRHEVDHIVPLEGVCPFTGIRNVSGRHVENNLRAIPWSLNRMRGDRYYNGGCLFDDSADMEVPF